MIDFIPAPLPSSNKQGRGVYYIRNSCSSNSQAKNVRPFFFVILYILSQLGGKTFIFPLFISPFNNFFPHPVIWPGAGGGGVVNRKIYTPEAKIASNSTEYPISLTKYLILLSNYKPFEFNVYSLLFCCIFFFLIFFFVTVLS